MKFIIGLFIGCLLTTIAAVVIQKNENRIVLSDQSNVDQVTLVKEKDKFGTNFSVFREEDELFKIDIDGNSFRFEVKGNDVPISVLRFSELIDTQTGDTSYSMRADRVTENELTQITYDMKTGLPSQIAKSSDSGVQIFDGEGTILHSQSEPVGSAKMENDGTIIMDLVARGDGMLGDARFAYTPEDKEYDEIIEHLGGLEPGEEKTVTAWKE